MKLKFSGHSRLHPDSRTSKQASMNDCGICTFAKITMTRPLISTKIDGLVHYNMVVNHRSIIKLCSFSTHETGNKKHPLCFEMMAVYCVHTFFFHVYMMRWTVKQCVCAHVESQHWSFWLYFVQLKWHLILGTNCWIMRRQVVDTERRALCCLALVD